MEAADAVAAGSVAISPYIGTILRTLGESHIMIGRTVRLRPSSGGCTRGSQPLSPTRQVASQASRQPGRSPTRQVAAHGTSVPADCLAYA